jgi:hypothetical protein
MPCRPSLPGERRVRSLSVAILLGWAFALATPLPAAAAPIDPFDEPSVARALPSVVYLEATYTGQLRDRSTGKAVTAEPVVQRRRCSGAVVSSDGFALTANGCIRPSDEVLVAGALSEYGRGLIAAGQLDGPRLDGFVAERTKLVEYSGAQPGTPPAVTLSGRPSATTPGASKAPPIPAELLPAGSAAERGVAVVRLRQANLPAIEIAERGPVRGDLVAILGYDRAGRDDDGPYVVRAKAVDVRPGGADRLRTSNAIGPYSRGGAVVDRAGRLVALLDAATEDGPTHELLDERLLTEAMTEGRITYRPGDLDVAYRDAVASYFDGEFSAAIGRFDDLLRRDPSFDAARTYRERAQRRLRTDGDAIENAADWLLYARSAVIGALIVGLFGVLGRRLKRRPAPPAGIGPPPAGAPGPSYVRTPPTLSPPASSASASDQTVVLSPLFLNGYGGQYQPRPDDTVILDSATATPLTPSPGS